MKKTLIAFTLAVASPLAMAGGYIGGSYSAMEYSESGIPDLSIGAISAIGGYQLNEYATIEARVGFGLNDDTYDGVKLELDHYYGAYFKFGIPVESFYPYVVAGYTKGELTASERGFSVSDSESDISYGLGLGYTINKNISINAEYMNFIDSGIATVDGFTFALNYRF